MISHKRLVKIENYFDFLLRYLNHYLKMCKYEKNNMTFTFHLLGLENSRITQYFNEL